MDDLQFKLTDEIWEDMVALEGAPISAIVVWDRSLADETTPEPVTSENRILVDIDLYLANQTKLELYGAAVSADEESDPTVGLNAIGELLEQHTQNGAYIDEIAADEEETLVLILANEQKRSLLIAVSAWLEDVWETLPDEAKQ